MVDRRTFLRKGGFFASMAVVFAGACVPEADAPQTRTLTDKVLRIPGDLIVDGDIFATGDVVSGTRRAL